MSDRDGNAQIYRMNADGTNQTRITKSSQGKVSPHLSRDGKTIVFCASPNPQGTQQIYKMNGDGTGAVQLTSNANANSNPTISPDGKTIAWGDDFDVWLMDINGNNQHLLSHTNLIGGVSGIPSPSFSPDGTLLVYSGVRNSRTVLIVRTLSNGNERIIDATVPALYIQPFNPRFSPDGTQILFSTIAAVQARAPLFIGVFLVKADGSDSQTPKAVVTFVSDVSNFTFNPSGGTLIYQTTGPLSGAGGPSTGFEIASADINGFGNEKILASSGSRNNFDPSFAG